MKPHILKVPIAEITSLKFQQCRNAKNANYVLRGQPAHLFTQPENVKHERIASILDSEIIFFLFDYLNPKQCPHIRTSE